MDEFGTVTITVPASRQMAAVLRSVAMSVASSVALTVDRVEDTALAMNESFRMVTSGLEPGTPVRCEFKPAVGSVRIQVDGAENRKAAVRPDRLGALILSGVAEDLDLEAESRIAFTVANRS